MYVLTKKNYVKRYFEKKTFKSYVIDSMLNYNILTYILFFINRISYRWMVLQNPKFTPHNIVLGIYVSNITKL